MYYIEDTIQLDGIQVKVYVVDDDNTYIAIDDVFDKLGHYEYEPISIDAVLDPVNCTITESAGPDNCGIELTQLSNVVTRLAEDIDLTIEGRNMVFSNMDCHYD